MSYVPSQLPTGQLLRTTPSYNITEIYQATADSPQLRDLLLKMYQESSDMLKALNNKETGWYVLNEYQSGALYFENPAFTSSTPTQPSFRNVFRKTFNTGQLPNTGTLVIPHGIPFNDAYTVVNYYGAASDTAGLNYVCLPYPSLTLTDTIEVNVDSTNIYITTGSNRSNFNLSSIVLEVLKS